MKLRSKKVAVLLGTGAIAAVAATSAYAFWTTNGSGSGSAQAGSDVGVTVTGDPTNGIAPGMNVPVVSTIHNDSSQKQYVTSLKVTISIDPAHAASCNAADFTYQQDGSFNSPSNPFTASVNAEIAANSTSAVDGKVFMADTLINQDGCKGATIQLAYAAS